VGSTLDITDDSDVGYAIKFVEEFTDPLTIGHINNGDDSSSGDGDNSSDEISIDGIFIQGDEPAIGGTQ